LTGTLKFIKMLVNIQQKPGNQEDKRAKRLLEDPKNVLKISVEDYDK